MTVDQISQDLRQGKKQPVYLLHGEEPYYIDQLVQALDQYVLDEAGKAFNQSIVYGKETEVRSIIDEAMQYPMMASHRQIIVKEAQELKKIQDLTAYCSKPAASTVLVIAYKYGKIAKNTKLYKAIDQNGVIFESAKIPDYKMSSWIANYLKDHKLTASPEVSQLIAEYLGNDLAKVTNEVSKLVLNLGEGTNITTSHVEELIGISKEYNVFELTKALSQGERAKALKIAKFLGEDQKNSPIPMVLTTLFNYFQKVHIALVHQRDNDATLMKKLGVYNAFFVKEYRQAIRQFPIEKMTTVFAALKTADQHSKGMGNRHNDPTAILTDLLYQII